jgi:hypothetical protein
MPEGDDALPWYGPATLGLGCIARRGPQFWALDLFFGAEFRAVSCPKGHFRVGVGPMGCLQAPPLEFVHGCLQWSHPSQGAVSQSDQAPRLARMPHSKPCLFFAVGLLWLSYSPARALDLFFFAPERSLGKGAGFTGPPLSPIIFHVPVNPVQETMRSAPVLWHVASLSPKALGNTTGQL